MRFLTIAAIFAVSVSSVFTQEYETVNSTVVIPVHVTTYVTELHSSYVYPTKNHVVTKVHTVHHAGFRPKKVTGLAALRTAHTRHHGKNNVAHTRAANSRHGRRDVSTAADAQATTVSEKKKNGKGARVGHKKPVPQPEAEKRGWFF